VATLIKGKAAHHLRSLGHDLNPVVSIGKEGITDGLVAAAKDALLAHELIKVRVQGEAPVDRKDAAAELADKTESGLAQVLGRTFLLYKRHPKKPKIVLPKERKAKPSEVAETAPAVAEDAPRDEDDGDFEDGEGDGDE
jgi:RNA-binding protein